MSLFNKVALVTGASKGIGAEIARTFVANGAKVAIAARDVPSLQNVKHDIEESGGECLLVKTDMRKKEEVSAMVCQTLERFNSIDILVNNAGYPMFGYDIDDESECVEERYEAIMETNLRGYWYATRFAASHMKKAQNGSIINISSVRGINGIPKDSAYCAAKGGVNMLTRSLAVELAQFNVRVNTICPGAIRVDLGHWIRSRYGDKAHQIYVEKYKEIDDLGAMITQPLKMIGRPCDVANAALYFASDESRFVTGSNLVVDGGLTSLMAEPSALDLEKVFNRDIKTRQWSKWN